MFFEGLSDEIILRIFSQTSLGDQTRLTQVSNRFNQIVNDISLELSNYKPAYKPEICSVGNSRLMVKKAEGVLKQLGEYRLSIAKNDKEVSNSALYIEQKSFKKLIQVKKNGALSIIGELKKLGGKTALKNAMILEEEFVNVNQALPVNHPGLTK
jgi:hypothetical protein